MTGRRWLTSLQSCLSFIMFCVCRGRLLTLPQFYFIVFNVFSQISKLKSQTESAKMCLLVFCFFLSVSPLRFSLHRSRPLSLPIYSVIVMWNEWISKRVGQVCGAWHRPVPPVCVSLHWRRKQPSIHPSSVNRLICPSVNDLQITKSPLKAFFHHSDNSRMTRSCEKSNSREQETQQGGTGSREWREFWRKPKQILLGE